VGTSVTRTWQDALDRGARTAVPAVLEALRHDVPARATLVDSLAAQLGAVALNRQPAEESTVGSIGLRLNQRRRRELVEALLSESGRMELEGILADEFDRSLSSVTSLDAGDEHAISELVEIAEREQRLGALIIAVRNKRPSAPRMLQIANELDLSTIHFSAGRLASATGRYDFDRVLARLGDLEGQIGRLELGSELIGTGLLVAPDILLVSASSLGGDQQLADGPGLHVRFGLKADSKGRRHDEGTLFPLQRDWLIDEIPYAGGSGFTLLRVAGYPADEPLGSGRAESMHLRRGFADISRSADMMEGQNALICWQQRSRLELHIERRALTRAGDVFTLPSLGDSSEGAPCFSRSMEFLGLVLENRAGVARIVPGVDLWQSLQDHGHGDTVGVGLS
jgi:hypothetical protein